MIYLDKVYGEIEITEPVIIDLINCPSVQRLKGIDQAGYFEPYFLGTKHTRFEHSLGVYILLKIYGASLEEQISGLIHDVSHSVFSHVIDGVLKNSSPEKQDHQDNIFKDFVRKSEISDILKKYNIELEYILDDKNFSLKEKKLPDLCADRIDYILRDSICFKVNIESKYFLDNLVIENRKWVFKNLESAEKFAELFKKMNDDYYTGLINAVMHQTVSDYLRYALLKGYILELDLYTCDDLVLNKIARHLEFDKKLQLLHERMNNKISFKNDPDNFDKKICCKSRIVDPLCFQDNKIERLSKLKPKWIKIIKNELKPKEYFLNFDR